MKQKFKALGIVFGAILAISMVAGSAAQAAQLHATVAQKSVITGHLHPALSQHDFQITGGAGPSVRCAEATFESTVSQQQIAQQVTTEHLTVTPTYAKCQAFGQAATVKINGCDFHVNGTGQGALTAQVKIQNCTPNKQIEVQTAICQITVGPQGDLPHIAFVNEPNGQPKHAVTATATVTGIKYQLHGAVCGHAVTVETSDGTYNGSATFQAYNDLGTHQIVKDGHTYTKYTHNTAVGLIAT